MVALIVFLGLFFAALLRAARGAALAVVRGRSSCCYKLQTWSHKIYNFKKDMTEFNKKYPKGVTLFLLLSLYELPILLNYLCFDRKSWSERVVAPSVEAMRHVPDSNHSSTQEPQLPWNRTSFSASTTRSSPPATTSTRSR